MKKQQTSWGRDLVQLLLVLAGLLILMNWGYFSAQAAAWWKYDLWKKSPVAARVLAGQPDRLAIPSIGLTAPLVYIDATDETTIQQGLENGVVHYPGTPLPGEAGNAYYFGHSSDYAFKPGHYKTVFAILPRVAVGDLIYITNRSGKQFIYKVSETKIVAGNDMSVMAQPENRQKILTLQTSWPLGTALKRYVVAGEMVKS